MVHAQALSKHRGLCTFRLSSSTPLDRSPTSIWRFSANDAALLTRPSISAPLKFLVMSACQHVDVMLAPCGLSCPLRDLSAICCNSTMHVVSDEQNMVTESRQESCEQQQYILQSSARSCIRRQHLQVPTGPHQVQETSSETSCWCESAHQTQ